MSNRKPAIPEVPPMQEASVRRVLQALKENVEIIEGRRIGRIEELSPAATVEQAVAKINELLARLQD